MTTQPNDGKRVMKYKIREDLNLHFEGESSDSFEHDSCAYCAPADPLDPATIAFIEQKRKEKG